MSVRQTPDWDAIRRELILARKAMRFERRGGRISTATALRFSEVMARAKTALVIDDVQARAMDDDERRPGVRA